MYRFPAPSLLSLPRVQEPFVCPTDIKGSTAAGLPKQVLDYGHTEVPQDLFEEQLQGMQDVFNVSVRCEVTASHFSHVVIIFHVSC